MIRTGEDIQVVQQSYGQALKRATARIVVCAGPGCVASGSPLVYQALLEELQKRNLYTTVDCLMEEERDGSGMLVTNSGCQGFCQQGPLVRVEPEGVLYTKVSPADVLEIVDAVEAGAVVKRLCYREPGTHQTIVHEQDIPFYKNQVRVALANCGVVDPGDIRAYIHRGGYRGLAAALERTSEDVIEIVSRAHLRGRGGGGFPAGRKWAIAARQEADQKYMICNGDEGDPGAFMDRSIMEGDPHSVIEGMLIGGYAIGANTGYIYVRAEYPLAVKRLQQTIAEATKYGLLGNRILGTDFSFHIHVKEGAGAFVCGEESALIASVEGRRGMPRPKPPFPVVAGLWGAPTVINNVETLANVPRILTKGADWFRSIGREQSPGTKTFALTGEVENTGLIEVPMGLALEDIVFQIGGGIRGGGELKAVQIGGPSGGCLTKEQMGISLDFDSLQEVGAMIGSGGLVVMDENTCVVEVARFFMNFIQNESCGKCTFCREGTLQMLRILQRIVDGGGTEEDLDLLVEIGEMVQLGSLCGLGKSAPNPILSTLENFREEYLMHVLDKRCPAGVCNNLRRFVIQADKCRHCAQCAKVCPANAITGSRTESCRIDQGKCVKCGACLSACRLDAIEEVY